MAVLQEFKSGFKAFQYRFHGILRVLRGASGEASSGLRVVPGGLRRF